MKSAVLACSLLAVAGCASTPSIRWSPDPSTYIEYPTLEKPADGEPATVPRDGRIELDTADAQYLLKSAELYPIAVQSYDRCWEGREADRREAIEIMRDLEEQRRLARVGQVRAAAVGAGAGAGAVAAIVLAVVLGTR